MSDPRFTCRDGGLWFDNGNGEPQRISDAFEVVGDAYDDNGEPHYILKHNGQHFALPWAEVGERNGWRIMRRHIRRIPTSRRQQERLADYLQAQPLPQRWTLTDTAGWHGHGYILPNGDTLGSANNILFQRPAPRHDAFTPRGTLAEWRDSIGRYAAGNSRMCLMLGAAFAAPLLQRFGLEGGILHLYGPSSSGKSTLQRVALSVWGHGRDAGHSWNATGYALTNAAASRNDGLLSLDEIGEDSKQAVETCAYAIANGRARLQGAKEGGNRPELRFRVLAISSGETSLQAHFGKQGRQMMAGQMVRCPSIPHQLEDKHDFPDFRAFTDHLNHAAITTYGSAGRLFIQILMKDITQAEKRLKTLYTSFLGEAHDRHPMTAQQGRSARLFALCAAALMQASEWGISGINATAAREGVMQAFADWYALQPKGSYEEARIREAAERFPLLLPRFVRLSEGQMFYPNDWAGYVWDEADGALYDVLPAVFVAHFCDGDKERIADACDILGGKMGWLVRPAGSRHGDRRWQHRRKVRGNLLRVYRFKGAQPPVAGEEEAEEGEDT